MVRLDPIGTILSLLFSFLLEVCLLNQSTKADLGYKILLPNLKNIGLSVFLSTLHFFKVLVGIWKSWFTQNTRIGIIEFELLNEYISMLNANPNADPDEIHKQMVAERSIREESTFDFIKRKYRESTSGINEKVDIFKKNYELNQ